MPPVPHRAGNGRIFVEKYKSRWKPYCGAGNLYAKNAFWVFWETKGEAFQPMQNAAVDWKTGGERHRETPTDTVYHETRSCTHLMLSVKQIPTASLKGLKQYGACGHCTKGKKKGSVVYVTDEGDCYHYTIHCSGLKRTVYMIRKEEAGGKPACSRCGGK